MKTPPTRTFLAHSPRPGLAPARGATAHARSTRLIPHLVDALNARLRASEEGITAAIDLAVLVATADGKLDEGERAALTASVEKVLGSRLDPMVVRGLIRESRRNIRAVGPAARARAIGELLAASGAVHEGLRLAIAIGVASNGLSALGRERIAIVARAAGVGAQPIDELARGRLPAESA